MWPQWLPDEVRVAIESTGISAPWRHQSDLAQTVFSGQHAAICTSTASGKTLAYLMPVLAACAGRDPVIGVPLQGARTQLRQQRRHTALYLSPTKALAHDQLRAARELAPEGFRAGALDGDSDQAERRFARDVATYVVSNPDMLHLSVLPNARRWSGFLGSLRYVIVDEAHRCRGLFGAHVAQVLRRLRRVCHDLGAAPIFVLSSATGTDIEDWGARLIGEKAIEVIDDDASPRPARDVVLWQPEDSLTAEAAEVMAGLVTAGSQTIAFVPSRAGAELVAITARERLANPGGDSRGDDDAEAPIASYRSGYLPAERRELEARLQSGQLMGVAATNALELGIDVSGMDAVVVAGFPGTMASLWQQAGRAGRRDRDALVVVMAGDDPRDQFLVSHPEWVIDARAEPVMLHPDNPRVLGPHLAAAAQELPLTAEDERWFGPTLGPMLDLLTRQGVLRRRPGGWFWPRSDRAVDHIDLRSGGEAQVQVVEAETGRVVGQVDRAAADRSVHAGAVYLHQGEQWMVEDYRPDEAVAMARHAEPTFWTQAVGSTELEVITTERRADFGPAGVELCLGEVRLTTQVLGYLRRDSRTNQVWDQTPLDMHPHSMVTRSMWWTIPDELLVRHGLTGSRVGAAAHAAEHTAIGLLSLFAPCDRWDVGGVSTGMHADTGRCTIFVHDGMAGGAGFAEAGHDRAHDWLAAVAERLDQCPCASGCPSCTVSPKCGNQNQMLDKPAARLLVAAMLGAPKPSR